MRTRMALALTFGGFALIASGCGSDEASNDAAEVASTDPAAAEVGDDAATTTIAVPDESGGESGGSGGGDAGSMVFGDETIAFDSARCFLQEQDAAAGGGKILFVAQAYGTTAGGEEMYIDVTRYDEDSQFSGDKINVVIGDPYSDESVSWDANVDLGTVGLDGSTVSADGLTFANFDLGEDKAGEFEVHC